MKRLVIIRLEDERVMLCAVAAFVALGCNVHVALHPQNHVERVTAAIIAAGGTPIDEGTAWYLSLYADEIVDAEPESVLRRLRNLPTDILAA